MGLLDAPAFSRNQADIRYLRSATIDTLPRPFVMAHRAGGSLTPEYTAESFANALAGGITIFEMDCWLLSDGTVGLMHDATVDRTTTSTGNVASFSGPQLRRLSIDAGTWFGAGYPNDMQPPLLSDILRDYGNRAVLVLESKNAGCAAATIRALQGLNIHPRSVLLQSFINTECSVAVAAGYPAMLLGVTAATHTSVISDAVTRGIPWVGVDGAQVTNTIVDAAHTAGRSVAVYATGRRHEMDDWAALGVDAIFSGDPVHLAGTYSRKTDPFPGGAPVPGFQLNNTTPFEFANGYWGFTGDVAYSALHGYLKPTDASNYTLDFTVRMDSASAVAAGAFAYLGTTDRQFRSAGAVGQIGYNCIIRQGGGMEIYYYDGTATSSAYVVGLNNAAMTDLVMGADNRYRLTVTPTTVGIRNLDTAQANTGTHSPAGSRPLPFVTLGTTGSSSWFKSVTVN